MDRSRAPHHSPQAIDEETAATIVAERQNRPTWGARKILQSLKRQQPDEAWPAASSIGELLKREGLIQARAKPQRTNPEGFAMCPPVQFTSLAGRRRSHLSAAQ